MAEPKKIGLLGGSFNPAHEGHLHISLQAIKLLNLDEVWWLVSPQNPLKSTENMAPLEERFASAINIISNPMIKATNLESELGTQYTIDTLNALKARYTNTNFIWLMGADNLTSFHNWKDWEKIFNMVAIAIFDRAPYQKNALQSIAAQKFMHNRIDEKYAETLEEQEPPAWVYCNTPNHPASSTKIRNDKA